VHETRVVVLSFMKVGVIVGSSDVCALALLRLSGCDGESTEAWEMSLGRCFVLYYFNSFSSLRLTISYFYCSFVGQQEHDGPVKSKYITAPNIHHHHRLST